MKKLLVLTAALALFAACNDEITEVNETTGIQMIATGEELDSCAKENAGAMVYVADSNAVYYCAENKWQLLNGKDGADGKDGKNGASGKDGVSAKDTVVVRDTVVGLNGKSCSVTDDGEGKVFLTCETDDGEKTETLYKALCGQKAYDPEKNNCVDEGLLPVCNKREERNVVVNTNKKTYTCDGEKWLVSTEREIFLKSGCVASAIGGELVGEDDETYVCRADGWSPYNETELFVGKNCTTKNQKESVRKDYSNWICRADSIGWVYDFENLNRDSVELGGKMYKAIGIGTQMWLAENLNYATVGGNADDGVGSFCANNNAANCEHYGRVYYWAAAMNLPSTYNSTLASLATPHQGLCPNGWHVPHNNEWQILYDFVQANNGGEGVGTSLKSKTGWTEYSGIAKGTDKFGFNGIPAGYWPGKSVQDTYIDKILYMWTVTEKGASSVDPWDLGWASENMDGDINFYKTYARSLRCLKD